MMKKINIGYIGSFLLAFCGLFEAHRALTEKTYDISLIFVLMWLFGEIFTLKAIFKDARIGYLIFNYGMNILFILVIIGRLIYNKLI